MKYRALPLNRVLVGLLVLPAMLTVLAVFFLADRVARSALEAALGARLVAVAQGAATLVPGRITLLERGDDDTRLAANALARLEGLANATRVQRIVVAARDGEHTLVDTGRRLAVGDVYGRARFDRVELEQVASGEGASSVLFIGEDNRPYKTGYAPLPEQDAGSIAFVAVEAAADYADAIGQLRWTLGGVALFGFAVLIAAAVAGARQVAVPLSALSRAAARIGRGQLNTPIPTGGPREARILEEAMRNMTASLKARDEEMQMMLAGIAHEVRNPLGGIELFGGLLREDLDPSDPRRKHVDKILRELGVLAKVVNDFLDFARRNPIDPRTVAMYDLAFDAVTLAEKDAQDKRVHLKLDADPALRGQVDPDRLRRALLNLIQNGIQAAPADRGQVKIVIRQTDHVIEFAIEDNGPGVPPERRDEIFAPFFTTRQKGTGLGLPLVKKTVVAHGGQISVDASEDGGARFLIRLPIKG